LTPWQVVSGPQHLEELTMKLYCGIDLHSNNHYVTLIDDNDRRILEKRLPNDLVTTLKTLKPYRTKITAIAVESTFNWYWLVDGDLQVSIAFQPFGDRVEIWGQLLAETVTHIADALSAEGRGSNIICTRGCARACWRIWRIRGPI
jgi:hypothetical protein